jgi:hypothetical protein
MPTMQDSLSVAANSVSVNVLAGQLFEFLQQGAVITLSVTGSAAGLRTTYICGVPMINDQAINLQNRFPLIPEDVMLSGQVPGGRQVLTFRNTTAGALTAFWRVDV